MDIIDIMLARAMTPQGQTDIYVNKANKAAATAEQAKQDAADAVATIEAAATTIETTQAAADDLLATAQETLETVQQAQINTLDTEDVDDEIKKFTLTYSRNTNNSDKYSTDLGYQYPDGSTGIFKDVLELKKSTGNSETSGMTQKAITDAIGTATTNMTSYVNNAVSNVTINLGSQNAGHLVTVGNNGGLTASQITENDLVNGEITPVNPTTPTETSDVAGMNIDYSTNTYIRTNDSAFQSMGPAFDSYPMYGGRVRCNVNDDGEITAFYGQSAYRDDGSNGQVMVYQPKFYYKRTPQTLEEKIIRQESLALSATSQTGYKLAPIFYDDLDYVLLSAYQGSLVDNKLASVSGQIPLGGKTAIQMESLATNRGTGWHIMNLAAVSANQMLEIVEFGSPNGQKALELGLAYKPNNSLNGYFITGSTASLGNATGHATATNNIENNVTGTYTEEGYRSISYRGFEDPWGNTWNIIGGAKVVGNGNSSGRVCICTDFSYNYQKTGANYHEVSFDLPTSRNWISAFGYDSEEYDWVFLPIEVSNNANSLIPIGDNIWIKKNLNGVDMLAVGGAFGLQEECGPFYYAADSYSSVTFKNHSARLMYIPTKNSIYTSNIAKWQSYIGG